MFYTALQYSTVKKYKYEIFTTKIERAIQQGHLHAGDALPSVRETKAMYQLSTSSVQSGYDYLVFKGLVTSIPRSGYVVAAHIQTTAATKLDLPTIPKDAVFTTKNALTSQRLTHTERPSFHIAAPASTFIPQQLILKTMQTVIREKGVSLLQYYPNTGSEELQALLIKRAALHGAALQKEELIVTDGALQALYIALASTTVPHDIVAVESPCVFSVLEVLSNLRLRALEIPVRPVHGFDLAYLRKMCQQHAVKAVVLTPNFHNPHTATVLVKTSPLLDIQAGLSELKHVKAIHIVALQNEVKELLWIIEKGYVGTIVLTAVNLTKKEPQITALDLSDESVATYAEPQTYLYEPNSALLKTGKFNAISAYFNVAKLHQHSQLYTSETLVDFSGRRFKIKQHLPYNKATAKEYLQQQKANVTVRNFPIKVDELRKKWKIKEGGDTYIFFTTTLSNQKVFLICEPV